MTALLVGDDRTAPTRMVRHINAATLWNLPKDSAAPADLFEQLSILAENQVEAIQHPFPEMLPTSDLAIAGMGRVDEPADAIRLAQAHKSAGYLVTTLHVGTGMESDAEIDQLVGAVIEASVKYDYPLFIETHRATVTQDIRRTLDLTIRFPDVRFNADLSHWYTGHEMTYGDILSKLDAMTPIFERVRYMHGRIGTPCCAQVALSGSEDDRAFVAHFGEMWRRCADGFLTTANPGEILPFAPELLPYSMPIGGSEHFFYYARKIGAQADAPEESDRWVQAGHLWSIMDRAWQSVLED